VTYGKIKDERNREKHERKETVLYIRRGVIKGERKGIKRKVKRKTA